MTNSVAKLDKLLPSSTTSLTFPGTARPTSFGVPLFTGNVGSIVSSAGATNTVTAAACTTTSKVLLISVKPLGSTPVLKVRVTPGTGQFVITPLTGSFAGGEKYDYVVFN